MSVSISVIIPAYNCADKIDSTLDSVTGQDAGAWECIVVDGGSADGTMARVLSHGSAVISVSEPDRGIYDAMNKGVALAKGEWLYFLGAGDRVLPDTFAEMLPVLNCYSDPTVVYGNVVRSGNGKVLGHRGTRQRLSYGENIAHQAVFYHRSVFERLGGYSLEYPILADFAYNLRCFGDSCIKMVYVDRVIAEYEGGGTSDTRRDERFFRDYPDMIRRVFGWFWLAIYRLRRLAGQANSRLNRR